MAGNLPKDKVKAAMQTAEQTVKEAWREISNLVFQELQDNRHWMPDLQADSKTWEGWLQSQWQFYWAAMPIGKDEKGIQLKNTICFEEEKETAFQKWVDTQNQTYNLNDQQKLFKLEERTFLIEAAKLRLETQHRKFSINVGSWWASIFDQTRHTLTSVKNARSWEIPTAFGPRSTVSGIGPVVHPQQDWVSEGDTKKCWQRQAGLFDGREQLNATETVKRGLEKVLPELLVLQDTEQIEASYPDLTAGVAGYLKVMETGKGDHWKHFNQACQTIMTEFPWTQKVIEDMKSKWGIPWIDNRKLPKKNHPRLLNAGWLVEDAEVLNIEELKLEYRCDLQKIIDKFYPNNNPANWYVLAAGDGDGMSQWLKGIPLKDYLDYIPQELKKQIQTIAEGDKEKTQKVAQHFKEFLTTQKRMGPSTHSALSRALLDFSNQLVPYLTEQRYAGRLIYGGGDDVLAYTNLWEWDRWLWDIRQCFQGKEDPRGEFENRGDYWQLPTTHSATCIDKRPLFTMGEQATISFGVIIAHHSVPLAIALENMWEAEKEAKEHICPGGKQKDAVQVRVLYGNGNILKATAKFLVFHKWQELLNLGDDIDAAIFEQAACVWSQHPAPIKEAIAPWTQAFCDRRELLQGDESLKERFQRVLSEFLEVGFIEPQPVADACRQIEDVEVWLKLAAFTVRQREIKLGVV